MTNGSKQAGDNKAMPEDFHRATRSDLKYFFLKEVAELERSTLAAGDYNALKLAAILRRMFVDGTALVKTANREYRLNMSYEVSPQHWRLAPCPVAPEFQYCSILPESAPPNVKRDFLSLDRFLSFELAKVEGEPISVKDLIKIAANDLGGIHFAPELDGRAQSALKLFGIGRDIFPNHLDVIREIGIVARRALEPLREAYGALPQGAEYLAIYDFDGQLAEFSEATYLTCSNFGWEGTCTSTHLLLSFPRPRDAGRVLTLELVHGSSIVLELSRDGTLVSRVVIGDEELTVRLHEAAAEFSVVTVELLSAPGASALRLYKNGVLQGSACCSDSMKICLQEFTLGAKEGICKSAHFVTGEVVLCGSELNGKQVSDIAVSLASKRGIL